MADGPNWQPAEAPPWVKAEKSSEPQWQAADAPPWAKQEKEERGGISEAVRPITTYLPTQKEMAKESLEQIGHGIEQLKEPTGGDLWKSTKAAVKGVGNVGLGAVGYVASPITAAYRTVVEKPVEETTGSPLAGQAAGFAAQLATPGIGFTRMPGAKPVPSVPTSTMAERRAGKAIERQASDIGKVKERLETEPTEIVPGSKQTTFEMTGDPGLGAAERKAKLRSPTPFVERAEERAGARLKALEEQQETGNVADTVEHLRQSRARGQWSVEQDVALADQRAREAAELPGGNYDPATYGNVLRQELRNAEEATRAEEGALWRQVDPGGTLRANPQPLQELERSIYGVMPEGGAAEASLTQAEQRVAGVIQNYRNIIPFQELRDLRHLINTELREELITSGRSPAYARLSRLRQGIADMEEGAFNQLGVRDPEASQRLRTASTATRERAEDFGRGPVGDVLRREGSQGPFKVETAQVNDKLLPTGNKGYDVASSYLRAAPESLEPYTDALTGKMRREVLRPDGSVDPRKLEGFLRRHDGVLRAVDERDGGRFSQSLRDIGQAQERLGATLERQRATTEAFEGSELGKLIGAADSDHVINVVGGIFGRADRVDRARQLAQAVSASPAAQAGLRRAVQQYVRRTFVGNAEAAGGTQMIPPNAFMNFMKENEAALRQIMLPEQVDSWKAIATEMGRTSRIAQTKTLPGSDTVQNALSVGGSWPWVVADMAIGQLTTGMPLPLGHAAKPLLKGLLSHLKKNGITSTNKLIDEAMLNPELARELLKAKGRPSGARMRMEQRTAPLLTTGTIRAATPDDEQQKRAPRQAGGGVPAIGGTGGRSPGARETARAGAARGGTGQALQDGGEAGNQQAAAPLGGRERFAAALQGTPTGAGFGGGGQQSKGKALKTPNREDIRRTLQSFGIGGEEAGGFAERQLGERSVDSRAYGGGVDDEPGGERAPIHYDPGDDTTFGARFGQWDKTATGKSLPRDDEDVDSSVMMPGDKMIDRYQFQGERGKAGYYQTRGMAEGGDVGGTVRDRWANLPDSRNVEDRRDEEPLSMGQLIAGNQAFMGKYPAPYTRGSRRAPTAQARADGGGVDDNLHQGLMPSTLLDETKNYIAEQIAGVEQEHEQQDPLEAAVKHSGAQKNPRGFGGSDEGKAPLPDAVMDAWEGPAARVRRRAPAREPDPVSLAASQGKAATWKQYLPSEERALQEAGSLQRGEGYNPRDAFLSALGVVGSPVKAVQGAGTVLGAGAVRAAKPVAKAISEAPRAAEVPMLLGNPELRGSMSTLENLPFTYRGKGPAEWTPEEFAEVGQHFGVPRLGPASPPKAFKYADGESFNIPGGLKGEFTYYDLLQMKAQGIDPSRIPRELHTELQQKLMRSMDVAQPVSPERTWSGLMFGMTSPNNPLFPNQLTQSVLRIREPGLRQQLAESIPWQVGDKVPQEARLAASDNIAAMLGINAGSKGGLGVRGSMDYTRIAELAQMWEKNPQWFSKTDAESWPNYVERLSSQVTGLSMKTGSFGGVWQDPAHAGVSAIDRHMVNEFERTGKLFQNKAEQKAFEQRAVERWNNANEDDPVTRYAQLKQKGEGFLTKMKLEYVGNEQQVKLRTRKGDISPSVPPHLANVDWPSEPSHVKVMGEAYRRALDWNQKLATQQGLNLFPSQWLEWDRIRRRFEPHENMFPGLERMPAMSREQLRKVSEEHTASGHKTYGKTEGEEGQMNLQPTRPRSNPAGFAYFQMPPVGGMPGLMRRVLGGEDQEE